MELPPKICPLDTRGVVRVAGDDARDFLQGLVTNDLRRLDPKTPLYAALLTPQGRFLFDFFLLDTPEGILLEAARCSALMKKLDFYRLRAQVRLEKLPWQVWVGWGNSVSGAARVSEGVAFRDPRLPELGERFLTPTALQATASPEAFLDHRLTLGVPDTEDMEARFPLECNLDHLKAIDFQKGCYVGQEVTSRVKRRGTVRKRLLPLSLSLSLEDSCPPPGTAILANGRSVGELCSGRGPKALGFLRLDKLNEALTANGVPLRVQIPSFLSDLG